MKKPRQDSVTSVQLNGEIFILSQQDRDGDWVMGEDAFVSPGSIIEHLVNHITYDVETINGRKVYMFKLNGNFRAVSYKIKDLYEEEPKPFIVEHVASHTDPDVDYDLYLNDQKEIYFCSCKDHERRRGPNGERKACKHMLELMASSNGKGYKLEPGLWIPVP